MDGGLNFTEIITSLGPAGIMAATMYLIVRNIVPALAIVGTTMQAAMQDQRQWHKSQVDALQARMNVVEKERDEVEERFEEMEKTGEDNMAQIIKLTEELRASEKAQRAALDELHKLRNELDKVKEERDALAKERDQLREQVSRLEKHVESLQKQMNGKKEKDGDEAAEKKSEAGADKSS